MSEWLILLVLLLVGGVFVWASFQRRVEQMKADQRLEEWRQDSRKAHEVRIDKIATQTSRAKDQVSDLSDSEEDRDKLAQMINRL
jgi:putative Mn2+ efflux pump MntP